MGEELTLTPGGQRQLRREGTRTARDIEKEEEKTHWHQF
jgi:hypothetical protein